MTGAAERCPNCDGEDCPTLTALCNCGSGMKPPEYHDTRCMLWQAQSNCIAHAVDWRARALAAEARLAAFKSAITREHQGLCAVLGCEDKYDPRWFARIEHVAFQACDGHGGDFYVIDGDKLKREE